jgi:cobalamin synthase
LTPTHTAGRLLAHNLDAVLAVLALPVFAIAGLPLEGWFWALALWALNRFAQARIERRAQRMDAMKAMGMMSASMLVRPWVGMVVLFVITRHDKELALSSVALFMVLITVDIATRIVAHRQNDRQIGGTV